MKSVYSYAVALTLYLEFDNHQGTFLHQAGITESVYSLIPFFFPHKRKSLYCLKDANIRNCDTIMFCLSTVDTIFVNKLMFSILSASLFLLLEVQQVSFEEIDFISIFHLLLPPLLSTTSHTHLPDASKFSESFFSYLWGGPWLIRNMLHFTFY